MHIRPFRPADESAVVALWVRCGLTRPWNDPHQDIAKPDLRLGKIGYFKFHVLL